MIIKWWYRDKDLGVRDLAFLLLFHTLLGFGEPLSHSFMPCYINPFQAFSSPLFGHKKGWECCSHPSFAFILFTLFPHIIHRRTNTLFSFCYEFFMWHRGLFFGYNFNSSNATVSTCVECSV